MIRKADIKDLESILTIYRIAKQFMKDTGNPHQWSGSYPEKELLLQDIQENNLYVHEQEGKIYAVFYYRLGEDTSYQIIEGNWLNSADYGVIHRIASDQSRHHILKDSLHYCLQFCPNVRIDTHLDNHVMQEALLQLGFQYCGIIHLKNGDPRLAYHFKK